MSRPLDHTVRRTPRAKRITVKVDPRDGAVEVVMPVAASDADAARAVLELEDWIARHRAKVVDARKAAGRDRLPGTVPYLGESLPTVEEPGRARVHHKEGRLLVPAGADRDLALERWYRREAKRELTPRVEAAVIELHITAPGRIRIEYARTAIRDQRTRWGSCSASGTISLNWRLLLAPDEVAEYVVVHEVCHLAEMNHSARYWELVGALFPEFERPRRWLRENASSLTL